MKDEITSDRKEAEDLIAIFEQREMGKKGLTASAGTGKPLKPIKTLAQLLAVIAGAK
jgi:hypothetical protein